MTKNTHKNQKEPLTREEFFDTLKKVTRPTGGSSEKEKSETSVDRQPDDCSEKRTH